MNPRMLTLVALLFLSLAAGVAIGEWYYRLYLSAIPPIALSDFNASSSRIAHLGYGAAVGVLLFAWTLLGMGAGRLMNAMSRRSAGTAPPAG